MSYGKEALYEILERSAEYFHLLFESPDGTECRGYVERERGLSQEIINKWQLGYAKNDWQGLLEQTRQRNIDDQLLVEAGLAAVADSGRAYDRFRDRLIFPVRDINGRVVTFGGRKLSKDDNQPKYLNGSDTAVFDKGGELFGLFQALQGGALERAIVVEGYVDVLSLDQAGVRGPVATMGTATSARNVETLFEHTDRIVFCFDGDRAGRDAAVKALRAVLPCLSPTKDARVVFLPEGEDPDSLVRRVGRDEFERLLDAAQPMIDFVFERLTRERDLTALSVRTQLLVEGSDYVSLIVDKEYRDHAVRRLAEVAMVDRRELDLQVPVKPSRAPRLTPG